MANPAALHQDLRDAIRDLCAQFPPEYFRKIDEARGYPDEFVGALTKAGWLAALIPQEYGGSGLGLTEASIIMVQDAEVERAYPERWIGKVEVATTDGRTLVARVDEPRGDPGNTLSRDELIDKAVRLAQWSGAASEGEVRALASRVFTLAGTSEVGVLLPARSDARADNKKVQA